MSYLDQVLARINDTHDYDEFVKQHGIKNRLSFAGVTNALLLLAGLNISLHRNDTAGAEICARELLRGLRLSDGTEIPFFGQADE